MSSHKRDHDGSVISPGSTSERAAPSDQLIEYQDLHRTGPIADRAFAKYEARGYQHGHDGRAA